MGRSPAPRSPGRTELYRSSQTRPPGHPNGWNGVVRHTFPQPFIYPGNVGTPIHTLSRFQGRLRNRSASSRSSGHYPSRRTISHHDYRSKCALFPIPLPF